MLKGFLTRLTQPLTARRRRQQLTATLPFLLQQLVTALSGGLSLTGALQKTADGTPSPWGKLINELLARQRSGANWQELWNEVLQQNPSEEIELFIATLLLANETGSGVRDGLIRLERIVTAKQQLREKVDALTAQGRLQGGIMSLLPFFLLLMIQLVDATYLQPLWQSRFGMGLLVLTFANNVMGLLWIRRIIHSFE